MGVVLWYNWFYKVILGLSCKIPPYDMVEVIKVKGEQFMKSKFLNTSIFIFSILCLMISGRLIWNLALYVDEHNTSPAEVFGGEFWLYMDWLRTLLLVLIVVFSLINITRKER
jgi:hypothetical protein